MGNNLSLVVSIAVPLLGGIANGFATRKDVATWYPKLKKPRWNPPNFLFGPVWTVLYTTQGIASWLVWKVGGKQIRLPLALYGIQLLLNFAWTPLFFKAHRLDLALADITAMIGFAAVATWKMAEVAEPRAVLPLMVPYLAWITFAGALNYDLWKRNPEAASLGAVAEDKKTT